MKVQEAITAVMRDVGAVGKGDKNEFHRFNFRGIDTTVNALSPHMRKHGLTVRPSQILDHHYEAFTTSGNKQSIACRLVVEFTFTGPEGDELRSVVAAEAADTGDKATPKAMSVAFRTALLQTFALPTQDTDPDAQVYERQKAVPQAPFKPSRDWVAEMREAVAAGADRDKKNEIYAGAVAEGAPSPYLDNVRRAGRG